MLPDTCGHPDRRWPGGVAARGGGCRARAGAKLPLLVRFPDILGQRLGKLQAAFAQAQSEWDYAGGYTAVYPIKVNQHRGVAGTLASIMATVSAWKRAASRS